MSANDALRNENGRRGMGNRKGGKREDEIEHQGRKEVGK